MDKQKQIIKQRIEELKTISEEVTTSDLQGICGAIALDINKIKYAGYPFEIENILLNYVSGEIDLNKCLEQMGLN